MIVSCECGAKLKIGDEKITDAGVKIKCPKCGTPHLVRKPAPEPAQTAPSMPWFAVASPVAAGPLVLIAHDSKVVADMIRNVLTEGGLAAEHAADGLDALKKAADLKPQAMIVDVGLTGIYGFELCERLKSDPDTRDIKIILLSSVYGLTAYKRSPVTLYGADDYIEKHHIPDKLVTKLKRLLSGEPAELPGPPEEGARPVEVAPPAPEDAPRKVAPLISRKGVLVSTHAAEPPKGPDVPPSAPAVSSDVPAAAEQRPTLRVPDLPDVMPTVPVTLDAGRKRPAVPAPSRHEEEPKREPERAGAAAKPSPSTAADAKSAPQDESIKLDAMFFEQEEYEQPERTTVKEAADPAEIEKARRFARLVVSDIVLYNQEIVVEGLAKGTFFDLLRDDITEGRTLYENRVPENIRVTKDYYQEAFDNFIATKKKLR